jgi:predicted metal-dependent hydrolase
MPDPSLEQQARRKVRIAVRMLADAHRLYQEGGRAYAGPGLNAETLAQLIEELTHRLAEADRLTPLGS